MELLASVTKLSKRNIPACINIISRNASIWNKDWKPGPYPRTEKERQAAAEKYGLVPSEYQPYADDGTGHGDYPKLPDISAESRDPYYPWDFPEHRRNLHEPLHVEADMYGADRYNISQKTPLSIGYQWRTFILVMLAFYGVYELLDSKPMFRPIAAKQYPKEGETHYTFELE